jgi:hypothetical protein
MGLPFTQSINHTDPFAEVRTEVLGTPYKVIAKVIRKFLSCAISLAWDPKLSRHWVMPVLGFGE